MRGSEWPDRAHPILVEGPWVGEASSAGFQPAVSQGFQPASLPLSLAHSSFTAPCRLEIGDKAGNLRHYAVSDSGETRPPGHERLLRHLRPRNGVLLCR